MIILLSPAKTLDEGAVDLGCKASEPLFASYTQELLTSLQSLSKAELQSTLGVSLTLASLNFSRYEKWPQQSSKPAGFAFNGPAYKALGLASLDQPEVVFCQQHLRILDGLYGLLRPLDSIKPYRLEMSNKVRTSKGKTLYAFWGDLLTDRLNRLLQTLSEGMQSYIHHKHAHTCLQEYFKAVNAEKLDYPVYNIHFPGASVYAKAARGAMARFIIQNKVKTPEQLKDFTGLDGEWQFNEQQSKDLQLTFVRCKTTKTRGNADTVSNAAVLGQRAPMSRHKTAPQTHVNSSEAKIQATGTRPHSRGKRRRV